jgi:delta 1-pyrroline-5-carboxylate dehydrogenase
LLHEAGVPEGAAAAVQWPQRDTVGAALVASPGAAWPIGVYRLDSQWPAPSTPRAFTPRRPITVLIARTGGINAMLKLTALRAARWVADAQWCKPAFRSVRPALLGLRLLCACTGIADTVVTR